MISTKGRYAIRVMIDLAENDCGTFIPLKDIAARQGISKKYLEIIVKDMVRTPEEYSIGEIIELMEGPLATVACLADGAVPCPRAAACETLPMWAEYDRMTHDFFYSRHLSDLLKKTAE